MGAAQGDRERVDVVVVGGGPAGLSAALMLGRCRRRVIVFDAGHPRNARARGVHGFLTREGMPPAQLLGLAREQLAPYDTVQVRRGDPAGLVIDACRTRDGFEVAGADGARVASRKLLLATGMVDELPALPGVADLWGRSVFPCPYCDAYEFRHRPLGVLGQGEPAATLARVLTTWSAEVNVFTGSPCDLPADEQARLARIGVRFVAEPVTGLVAQGDQLVQVVCAGRPPLSCSALFVSGGQRQRSPLVQKLGCALGPRGTVEVGKCESTNVPGLYVAGDASDEAQLVVMAAAEGAQAACEINRALSREDYSLGGAEP